MRVSANGEKQKQQQQAASAAEGGQKKKKVTAAQLRAQKGFYTLSLPQLLAELVVYIV